MRVCEGDIEFLRSVGVYGLLSTEDARFSYPEYLYASARDFRRCADLYTVLFE